MLNISTNVILESTCTHLLLSLLLNCFLVKLFYQLWCFVKDSNYRIISFVRDLIPCFIFLFIIFYICSFGLEVSLVAKMLTCIERKFFKTKLKYLKICFISFKFIKSSQVSSPRQFKYDFVQLFLFNVTFSLSISVFLPELQTSSYSCLAKHFGFSST